MLSRFSRSAVCLSVCIVGFSLVAPSGGAAASFPQENKPENLKAFFELIYQSLYTANNPKQAAALFGSLMPNQERLRKALKDGVEPGLVQQILARNQELGLPTEGNIREFMPPGNEVVKVFGATTEELAARVEGSPAWAHFAGGSKKVAEQVLRPQMMFYQIKLLKPGETAGMTYHLFYWDGQQWSMLGKVWWVLR